MDEMERMIAELTAPVGQSKGGNVPIAAPAAPQVSLTNNNNASGSNYIQIRQQLENCPTWILRKLRDEMTKRKQAEDQWNSAASRIATFENELQEWKRVAIRQLELERAKSIDHLQEVQSSTSKETTTLKELVSKKEDFIREKEKEILEKNELIKSKDEQIRRLSEQIERLKTIAGNASSSANDKASAVANILSNIPTDDNKRKDDKVNSDNDIIPFTSKRASWLDTNARGDVILELLFKPDMVLLSAICDAASGKLQDEVVKALLHLFEARGESMKMFEFLIQKEVSKTRAESTLFRSNSVASKMMTLYSKTVGLQYLTEILKPLLQEVIAKNESLEVDPNKAGPNENPEENIKKIRAISQHFLDTILKSLENCPTQFREICNYLYSSISKKFPDDPYNGIKNFIFLRYICPAILAPPKEFGLDEVKESSRRTLVLISKILQNVVNMVEFKEPHMKNMNSFVNENIERMRQCLKQLGETPSSASTRSVGTLKGLSIRDALKLLITSMTEMKVKLLEELKSFSTSNSYTQPMTFRSSERLISICLEIGMPKKGSKKVAITQGDGKIEELKNMLAEEDKMVAEALEIAQQEKESKFLQASSFIITSVHPSSTVAVIKQTIKKEIGLPVEQLTSESLSAKVFGLMCQLITSDYFKELLTSLMDELNDTKEDIKPNSDKLMELTQKVLANFLKSLTSSCPSPVWDVCSYFYQESKHTRGPKGPIDRVVMFLFLNLFAPAVESPENYITSLSEPPKKKVKKALGMIADVLKNIALVPEDLKDVRMLQFVKKRYEITCQLVEDWVSRPFEGKHFSVAPSNWSTEEEHLRVVHLFLCEKLSSINSKLGNHGNTKKVQFHLPELVEALVSSPTKADAIKSSVF